jgi:hypothetical protein
MARELGRELAQALVELRRGGADFPELFQEHGKCLTERLIPLII